QVLAVDLDAGLVQAVDQLAVGEPVLARGGVDARDPQAAEIALALLAVAIGVDPGALDRLASDLEQTVARAGVALRLLQDPVVPAPLRDASLHSRHGAVLPSPRLSRAAAARAASGPRPTPPRDRAGVASAWSSSW